MTSVGRDLGLLLKHLLGSTNREFFAALQDAGISFSQLKCLGLLANADASVSLGALSEQLGLSLAAVSRAVDGLVQRGQVKRQEDPNDRRSKLVTLSARGAPPTSAWSRSASRESSASSTASSRTSASSSAQR
jgi:DNA-binding transcriptional regulator GbsR (MarR family)